MQARIESPAQTVPGAMAALQRLGRAVHETGIPETTLKLVGLRSSQINGCAVCVDMHARELRHLGEPDARIFTVAAWREAPYFTDAERAALALTEAATRIADRPDAVSDEIWDDVARHLRRAPASAGWSSPSPGSTPGTASMPPPGRSPASGSSSSSLPRTPPDLESRRITI